MSSQNKRDQIMAANPNRRSILLGSTTLAATSVLGSGPLPQVAQAQQQASTPATSGGNKPNIVFIMGDDIGWSNIGVYNQGLMAGRTPNLDRMANEGMRFTDYYAEASCTAGRANFITGEIPMRTGLTTVGQAGASCSAPRPLPRRRRWDLARQSEWRRLSNRRPLRRPLAARSRTSS